MANGHQRRREVKTDAIVSAAADLFSASGIDAVAMDDVATAAGVSKVTIYKYFGSKEALVFEVFKAIYDKALEDAEALVADDDDFLTVVEHLVQLKLRAATAFDGNVARDAIQRGTLLGHYIQTELAERIETLVVGLLERGRQSGHVRADIDNTTLLAYFDLLNAGLAARINQLGTVTADPDGLRAMIEVFFYGLITRPPGGPVERE